MLHELLPLLPDRLITAPTGALAAAAAGGVLLGSLGARFSRAQFTLAAVAAGAFAGTRLPSIFHWTIDPMCLGVAAAVVLGTAGFLFHRTLVALSLGAVLALWALAGTWIARGGGATWDPSGLHWTGDAVQFLRQLWQSLPGDLGRLVPAFCTGALVAGLLTGIVWPRLSRCLFYSVAGLTVTVTTGLVLIARLRPDWLARIPESSMTQIAILLAWAGLSLFIQWRTSPEWRRRAKLRAPQQTEQRLVAKTLTPRPARGEAVLKKKLVIPSSRAPSVPFAHASGRAVRPA